MGTYAGVAPSPAAGGKALGCCGSELCITRCGKGISIPSRSNASQIAMRTALLMVV